MESRTGRIVLKFGFLTSGKIRVSSGILTLGREMITQGDSLEPRESHVTMTYNNRFLVIYGGIPDSKEDDLLAIVDTVTGKTRRVKRSEL